MSLEKELVKIYKRIEDEKRLGDKRAEQFYNLIFGGQLKFPATQNPSADPNTLDDYEEGTWTPIDASGAGLNLVIDGQSIYTKIGNMVWASCRIVFPTTADGSAIHIGGLPFTVANNLGNCGGGMVTLCYVTTAVTVYPVQNSVGIYFYKLGGARYTNAEFSEKLIIFSVQYQVA